MRGLFSVSCLMCYVVLFSIGATSCESAWDSGVASDLLVGQLLVAVSLIPLFASLVLLGDADPRH
jgi:hypothetical protein